MKTEGFGEPGNRRNGESGKRRNGAWLNEVSRAEYPEKQGNRETANRRIGETGKRSIYYLLLAISQGRGLSIILTSLPMIWS
jgi:hypothetical protein